MKHQLFILFGALLTAGAALTSCQPEGYTLRGTLTGDVEGKTVYLCKGDDFFTMQGIDSTIVRNGQFEFRGRLEAPELLTVKIFPDSTRNTMGKTGVVMRPIIPLLVDNGLTEIEACVDSLPLDFMCYGGTYDYRRLTVRGPELLTKYMAYRQLFTDRKTAQDEPASAFYGRTRTDEGCGIGDCVAFVRTSDSLQAVLAADMAACIRENSGNIVGLYALKAQMKRFDAATLAELTALLPASLAESKLGAEVLAKADTIGRCAIGAPFLDLELQDPEGNAFRLSDKVGHGRYALVEFWASWCGPCRAEIPHLKHVYELYHPEGFDIVSISMDEKKEKWLEAIGKEGMTWEQGSDLQAFKGPITKLYQFEGIPYCVLVGPDGTILHHNARGPQLDEFLVRQYGNKFEEDYKLYK